MVKIGNAIFNIHNVFLVQTFDTIKLNSNDKNVKTEVSLFENGEERFLHIDGDFTEEIFKKMKEMCE